MTIAVCIVNHNTRELLRNCLQSIIKETPDEILVIDNASTDGSARMVETEFPSVGIIKNQKNVGYGAAANRAVWCCGSDYIFLLNSDTILQAGATLAVHEYLDAHPRAAIVGPRILNLNGTFQTSCFHYPTLLHVILYLTNLHKFVQVLPILRRRSFQSWALDVPTYVSWVLGAAMGIRRAAFEKSGGFDETFFMYFEEVDLCYRLSQSGWEVHFTPVPQVIHLGGASTRQVQFEMTLKYFHSLQHFYRKHYSILRVAGLFMLLESMSLAKLITRQARLLVTTDPQERAALTADKEIWQSLRTNIRGNLILSK